MLAQSIRCHVPGVIQALDQINAEVLTSKIRTKVGTGTLKLDLGPQNNLIKNDCDHYHSLLTWSRPSHLSQRPVWYRLISIENFLKITMRGYRISYDNN